MSNQIRLFMQYLTLFFISLFILSNAIAESEQTSLAEKNYTALYNSLSTYQNAVIHPWPTVYTHTKIKLGKKNSAIPLLITRLKITNDLPKDYLNNENIYDLQLEESVKTFQQRHGLKVDGIIGDNTLNELNIPANVRVKQIQANLLRWALLTPQLNNTNNSFILVNIPEFQLYIFENNQQVLKMKAIVGKPDRQTPEITSKVTRIILNPYWNVPDMIAYKDIIPKIISNPNYLDEMNIKIFDQTENNSYEINQDSIDWQSAENNGFNYHFRQEPGNNNALGLIKFEFKNSDDIYLHDTPAKELFNQDTRVFSSGCIRLENPFALADYLMRTSPIWNNEYIEEILETGKTTYINASEPMPLFITYITAWVDETGIINFRPDVYEKDGYI